MPTFISYASEYDLYKGEKSIASLTAAEQDELINALLDPARDFRELVVHQGIKKTQAEGLWSLIVFVGLELERANRISSFDRRTEKDIQEIIAFFSGTKLWLRLEEAYPPFAMLHTKTDYPWTELEKIKIDSLTEATGEPLYKVKSKICEYLVGDPSQLRSEVIDRMPYHAFKQTYDEGKLVFFFDKRLALTIGQKGLIKNPIPKFCSIGFPLSLIGFIPVGIFVGFWYGLATLLMALICKRLTTHFLGKEIRKLALSEKEIYRWLLARKVIWFHYVWEREH